MKNAAGKKNGLRKVMMITGICFILGLFSGCMDLSDTDHEASSGDAADTIVSTEEIASGEQTSTQKEAEETGKAETSEDLAGLTVTFLDVGQGNAVLFSCDGHYMMMDGGPSKASSFVVAYLKKQNIETLDYVIASHYDSDHISGLVGVLNVFDTDTFIGPDYEADTKIYDSLMDKLEAQNLTVTFPKPGDTYTFGDAVFTVVAPVTYSAENENDNSVGIRLTYGKRSFLIYGDGEEESERAMIASGEELASDVLMVSHHGSRNATTAMMLQAVKPDYAVISVGADNSYGHPTEEVLDRLAAANCTVYRTDLNGTIQAYCDGDTITFTLEKDTDLIESTEAERSEQEADSGNVTEATVTEPETADVSEETYIINTNTGKFHKPSCRSVKRMNDSNKKEYTGSRDDLIAQGYEPCKNCNP